jgi:DNA-binding transcriptional MerR regulator
MKINPIIGGIQQAVLKKIMPKRDWFSTGEVSRITGVPMRTLDYWARTRFLVPGVEQAKGTGTERKYAFRDLVALGTAKQLRGAGLSTQALRHVVASVRKYKQCENPLAESRLIIAGSDVQIVTDCDQLMSVLRRPGQGSFAFMLDLTVVIAGIKRAVAELRAA